MNKSINILIVEDEVIVALDIEQRLLQLGYKVLGIKNKGTAVLEYLSSKKIKPDLILMDIHIKGKMTGVDLSDTINSKYNIPIIFLTANSNLLTIEKAQLTNPYGFVFKPFSSTDLKVAIEIANNKFCYEQQLEVLNNELEKRVIERTKDLKQTNLHLEREIELRNEMEVLLIEERKKGMISLFEGEEKERKRISQELHDNFGQKLTAAKLSVGSVLLDDSLNSKSKKILSDSKEILEECMEEVRELSQNLYPSILSDFGLEPGIRKIAGRISHAKNISCEINVEGDTECLTKPLSLCVYRICQEAISNAVKHAGASKIIVELCNSGSNFTISIMDNGIGMDINKIKKGSGLNNMKERAAIVQAEFLINSVIGKGTEIKVRFKNGE